MKQGGKSKLLLAILFFIPLTCLADAGTPLMWAGMLHLLFGNALIGVGEGLLLAYLFRLKRSKCVGIMIAANYFSAWVGDVFIMGYAFRTPDLDIYSARRWIWSMILVTFVLTCILEWPFVFFCLRKTDGKMKKSLRGNLLIQACSYIVVFGWYWAASGKSLYTQMHVVKPFAFSIPTNSVLYFISTNGNVCSMKLPDGKPEKVSNLICTNDEDRIFVRKSDSGMIDIYARIETGQRFPDFQRIVSSISATAAVEDDDQTSNWAEIRGNWDRPQWFVPAIGSASNSLWKFHCGFWAVEGLRGENQQTGEKFHLSFETPFVHWVVRNAFQLPGDCVIFQLGEDQICALEPVTRRVCLLARGRGSVVVIE